MFVISFPDLSDLSAIDLSPVSPLWLVAATAARWCFSGSLRRSVGPLHALVGGGPGLHAGYEDSLRRFVDLVNHSVSLVVEAGPVFVRVALHLYGSGDRSRIFFQFFYKCPGVLPWAIFQVFQLIAGGCAEFNLSCR